MSIRNNEKYDDPELQRLVRKRDQEWDMAGLARQDGDTTDEKKHTEAAREYGRQIRELLRAGVT